MDWLADLRSGPDDAPENRPLTEAEYRAWADHRMRELADEFSGGLLQVAGDTGNRFEFEWLPGGPALAEDGAIVDDLGIIGGFPKLPYGEWHPYIDRLRSPKCYRLASGSMVHVKPGCRCPR